MAWIYRAAYRAGNLVTVELNEPTRGREQVLPPYMKMPGESEAQFVTRVQGEIASWVQGLNAQMDSEADVTNIFRPPNQ